MGRGGLLQIKTDQLRQGNLDIPPSYILRISKIVFLMLFMFTHRCFPSCHWPLKNKKTISLLLQKSPTVYSQLLSTIFLQKIALEPEPRPVTVLLKLQPPSFTLSSHAQNLMPSTYIYLPLKVLEKQIIPLDDSTCFCRASVILKSILFDFLYFLKPSLYPWVSKGKKFKAQVLQDSGLP